MRKRRTHQYRQTNRSAGAAGLTPAPIGPLRRRHMRTHKLRSREDQVVQSEIVMYEAGWGWPQSENVLHKFVRQGLKRRRKHGDAFVDKLRLAISSTPGTDTTEILRQLSDIDVGECCPDGDH